MEITKISDTHLKQILTIVGVPALDVEDLELTKEDILEVIITPAVREYITWYPLKEEKEYSVSGGTFTIPFPDDAFSVIDARVNTSSAAYGKTTSPFMNSMNYINPVKSQSRDVFIDNIYRRLEKRSIIESNKSIKFHVDEEARVFTGQTNISGKLNIIWTKTTDDFSKIPLRRLPDVIQLAKSYAGFVFYEIRSQQNNEGPVTDDVSQLEKRATKLRDDVITKWQKHVKVAVGRG